VISILRSKPLNCQNYGIKLFPKGLKKMIPEKIKQVVKSRYSKFAETGGSKDSC
jgi:hypothetical protein